MPLGRKITGIKMSTTLARHGLRPVVAGEALLVASSRANARKSSASTVRSAAAGSVRSMGSVAMHSGAGVAPARRAAFAGSGMRIGIEGYPVVGSDGRQVRSVVKKYRPRVLDDPDHEEEYTHLWIHDERKPNYYTEPTRAGVIALKVGMISGWDQYGAQYPLTILKIEDCHVTQVKTEEKDGFNAVQVGAVNAKNKHVNQPQIRHCEKAGVPTKRNFAEFQVSPEGILPLGTELTCRHFVPGQHVDIQGKSIGKGFQGGMKRFGFAGQGASHGHTRSHRSIGSIGGCQDPGRVFKGKKMPGRMGNKTRTVQNLVVHKIDPSRNLVYVRGHVVGHKGNHVIIQDAKRKLHVDYNGEKLVRPFPTYTPTGEETDDPIIAPPSKKHPLDSGDPLPKELTYLAQQQQQQES